MRLLPGVMRFHGRDIVNVEMEGPDFMKGRQPFYRSSGQNSRMPGKWLPFDGIVFRWFDKTRFCKGDQLDPRDPLHRYGEQRYKDVGELLDAMTIEPAPETEDFNAINRWLGLL